MKRMVKQKYDSFLTRLRTFRDKKGRDHFDKKALQSAPYKSAKIAGFKFHFDFTNMFGEDFSRLPAGKIY
jgi:hypothetical protein